jgi:hypothetical protein
MDRRQPCGHRLLDRISWDGDKDLDLMLANVKKAIESWPRSSEVGALATGAAVRRRRTADARPPDR